MPPHVPSRDESLSHLSHDRLDESTAEDAGAEEESEPAHTDEDAERFCAYRTHRYGQSRDRGRDLLLRMSQALVDDSPGPWHFDFEPLGITRPGAENPDRANGSNLDAPDGEPEGASQAGRGWFLMLRSQSPGPGRPWSPPAVSPRSQDTSTQRTVDVQRRTIQGGNAQTLDTLAAISAVESSLEGSYASGTRGPGNPALDTDNADVAVEWEIESLVPQTKGDITKQVLQDGRQFNLGGKRDKVWSTSIEDTPARTCIARLLREAGGIPTIYTPSHSPVQIGIAAACLPDQEAIDVKERYGVWKVVSELDFMSEGIKLDFEHAGLKLSSRKLAVDEAGFAELEQVPHLLRNNVLVGLSSNCGLYIHVDASCLD